MDKFVFHYKDPKEFTLELVLDKGTVQLDLKNEKVEKHFFLDDQNRTCSIFLEKDDDEPKFRYYNEYLEIIIILINNPNKFLGVLKTVSSQARHLSVTLTDTRYPTQITLFDKNMPLQEMSIEKNKEAVKAEELLPALYESFINYQ